MYNRMCISHAVCMCVLANVNACIANMSVGGCIHIHFLCLFMHFPRIYSRVLSCSVVLWFLYIYISLSLVLWYSSVVESAGVSANFGDADFVHPLSKERGFTGVLFEQSII
jgi:hypothetical protein